MNLLNVARRVRDGAAVRRTGGTSPSGTPLPPRPLRQGGRHFLDDADFVTSGRHEVERLNQLSLLPAGVSVVDLGSGSGRFAVGLIEQQIPLASYLGVEVQERHVQWCRRHLTAVDRRFEFVHVDAANGRYNPKGHGGVRLPVDDGSVNLLYAFSVFTHMRTSDVSHYLAEASRCISPFGAFTFTAFVERDCPAEEENPAGYGPLDWTGPLHCVRFSHEHMQQMIDEAGLTVDRFDYGTEQDGQSFFVVRPQNMHPITGPSRT
jgi:SAM-dependent methyltransferase